MLLDRVVPMPDLEVKTEDLDSAYDSKPATKRDEAPILRLEADNRSACDHGYARHPPKDRVAGAD
jgi:hypothetical protein